MPVEQRSRISQLTGVLIAIGAIVLAVGASWGLLKLASGGDGPVRIQLGDEDFDAGQINRISDQIAEEGPVLYSDVSGRGQLQPIWVNHFGEDPAVQWFVFSAIAPGADQGCFLAWNAEENLFDERRPDPTDPRALGEICRDVTYSATGEAGEGAEPLEQFTWSVDDEDNLIIDIRGDSDKDSTDD
ncbi:MAG: hypothetical protein M9922_15785 [Microthrixaceae bacterium]|nr:hypothetical protein [Microthrixaceae bacterium]